jgi:hypothetical protein
MAITTNKNTNYGPPLVNQKYAPLLAPVYAAADQPIYTGLLNNRMTMLRALGLIGQQLRLVVSNWDTVTNEAGRLPPLVVVSSNRARWIRAGIAAALTQRTALGIDAYNSASDLRALTDVTDSLNISPPLYAPSRIGADRTVYIVVQMAEYPYYAATLADSGVTVVGWEFAKAAGARRNLAMVGFGATRFAAMQFCKTLRARLAAAAHGVAPWNSAWLIDDNTVALSSFAGFAAVEAALGANVCAGFHGGTAAGAAAANKAWARAQVAAGRGQQAATLPASAPPGIIQQTALWNISYFETNHLNFGPLFISSAEDLSITNYFNRAGIGYLYYNGIGVVKELPTSDDRAGAQKVNKARQDLTAWVTAAESANPPTGVAPPPIIVQPVDGADGGEQTLSAFITTRVLPNASATIRGQADNVNTQAQAKCQGVEQLTSGALNAGLVSAAAIAATFRINGTTAQVVETRNAT